MRNTFFIHIDKDNRTAVLTLMYQGKDPTVKMHPNDPMSPLLYAVTCKRESIVRTMAKHVKYRFTSGAAEALFMAVWSNQPELVPFLCSKPPENAVNVDKHLVDGKTALRIAVDKEYSDAALFIIEQGGSIAQLTTEEIKELLTSNEIQQHPKAKKLFFKSGHALPAGRIESGSHVGNLCVNMLYNMHPATQTAFNMQQSQLADKISSTYDTLVKYNVMFRTNLPTTLLFLEVAVSIQKPGGQQYLLFILSLLISQKSAFSTTDKPYRSGGFLNLYTQMNLKFPDKSICLSNADFVQLEADVFLSLLEKNSEINNHDRLKAYTQFLDDRENTDAISTLATNTM